MAVRRKAPDVFEVDSETSKSKRSYVVSWGTEGGDFWVCTCPAFSINRNRAGGLGHPGNCKHVKQVEAHQEVGEDKLAESLREIEKSLRKA